MNHVFKGQFYKEIMVMFLFGLLLNVSVNSCGHVRTVISPNHTFLPE